MAIDALIIAFLLTVIAQLSSGCPGLEKNENFVTLQQQVQVH